MQWRAEWKVKSTTFVKTISTNFKDIKCQQSWCSSFKFLQCVPVSSHHPPGGTTGSGVGCAGNPSHLITPVCSSVQPSPSRWHYWEWSGLCWESITSHYTSVSQCPAITLQVALLGVEWVVLGIHHISLHQCVPVSSHHPPGGTTGSGVGCAGNPSHLITPVCPSVQPSAPRWHYWEWSGLCWESITFQVALLGVEWVVLGIHHMSLHQCVPVSSHHLPGGTTGSGVGCAGNPSPSRWHYWEWSGLCWESITSHYTIVFQCPAISSQVALLGVEWVVLGIHHLPGGTTGSGVGCAGNPSHLITPVCPSVQPSPSRWHYWEWSGLCWESITSHYTSVSQCPAITLQVALLGVEWVVLGIHHISLHQCVPLSSHQLPGGTTGSGVGCAGNPSPSRWHYWEWSGLCWESITSHYTSVFQCPAITLQVALQGVEWVVLGIHHISLHQCVPVSSHHLPGGTTGSGVGCAENPSHLITPVCPSVQPSPSRWHYWEWSGLCWESITSHYTSVSQCPAITLQVALLGVEWVVLGIHHISLHQCVPVSSHHPPGGTTGSGVGCAGNPSHLITPVCPSVQPSPSRWHYWEWSGLCWESITYHYTSVSQCPAITLQVALLGVEWVVLGIHHLPGGTTGSGVGCAGNPSHLITPVCPSVQPSPSRWHYWEWSGLCWESITSHYTSVSQCPAITLQVALLGVEWVVLGIHHISLHQCVPVSSHHPPGGTTGSGVGCAGNPSHLITPVCPSVQPSPSRWHYWEWSGLCWESITSHYTSVSQCPAISSQVALLGVEWVVLGIHHLPGGTTGSGVGCAGNPSHLITPVCPRVQPSPSRWHYWEWSGLCWESITSHYTSVSQCPAITSQVALLGVEWVVLRIHHISLHQCVPGSSHHPPGGTTGSGVGCAGNPSHLITPVCPSVQPSPPRWHYWEWSGLCWESITSHYTWDGLTLSC